MIYAVWLLPLIFLWGFVMLTIHGIDCLRKGQHLYKVGWVSISTGVLFLVAAVLTTLEILSIQPI